MKMEKKKYPRLKNTVEKKCKNIKCQLRLIWLKDLYITIDLKRLDELILIIGLFNKKNWDCLIQYWVNM